MFDFKNDKKIDDPYLPPVKVTIDESNSGLDPNKYQYIQFLANQMYTQLSKEVKMSRQQCQYYGQQYRDFQVSLTLLHFVWFLLVVLTLVVGYLCKRAVGSVSQMFN